MEIWPPECQNEVKIKILDKYKYFYERLLQIESSLSDKMYKAGSDLVVNPTHVALSNATALEAAKRVENHTQNIYPGATQKIRDVFKTKQLQMSQKNDRIYMSTQNRRIHKHAQPLTGYVEESDYKRLNQIKNLVFPSFRPKSGAENPFSSNR